MSEIIRYHSNMSVINFTRLDENRRIRIYDSYRPALCVPFLSIIFYEIVKQIVLRDESHIAVRNMRCVSCMKDVRYMYIYIYIYVYFCWSFDFLKIILQEMRSQSLTLHVFMDERLPRAIFIAWNYHFIWLLINRCRNLLFLELVYTSIGF